MSNKIYIQDESTKTKNNKRIPFSFPLIFPCSNNEIIHVVEFFIFNN